MREIDDHAAPLGFAHRLNPEGGQAAMLIGAAPFTERRLGGSVDLQAVGGELEIESRPQLGTRVRLKLADADGSS